MSLPQESAPEVAITQEPIGQEGAEVAIRVSRPPRQKGAGVVIGTCEPIRSQSGEWFTRHWGRGGNGMGVLASSGRSPL